MLDRLYEYINDNQFRFTVYKNKIHAINYKKILSLEDNFISLLSNDQKIVITGTNFALKKLLENEILVTGKINKIEAYDE